MAKPSLTDASSDTYTIRGNRGTHEEIDSGSLQRIATACERMASDREELERRLASISEAWERSKAHGWKLERKNRALRGVITKMRSKRNA
jgi:hypothetical protein